MKNTEQMFKDFLSYAQSILSAFVSEIATVQKNMETYGGSFERGLANALLHADMENAVKIKTTWPALWEKWWTWNKKGEQ